MTTRTTPTTTGDVEQLLRRMYGAVADHTIVALHEPAAADRSPDARVVPLMAASGRRPVSVLAAAAVVALIVGGFVLLSGREASAPAGRGEPRHVVPAWIPQVDVGGGDYRRFTLTELSVEADVELMAWATQSSSISIMLDRTGSDLPEGEAVEVRRTVASRSPTSLSWFGPDGALVTVSWTGAVDVGIVDTFVDGLVYADDAMWAELTSHGGFRADRNRPLAGWTIESTHDVDVELVGDLRGGLSLQSGSNGWSLPITACRWGHDDASTRYPDPSEGPDAAGTIGYVILAPGTASDVRVQPPPTAQGPIAMQSLAPLLDVSIGAVVYPERSISAPPPIVTCTEGTP